MKAGDRVGSLVLLARAAPIRFPSGQKHPGWDVRCDCGGVFTASEYRLKYGTTHRCRSCVHAHNGQRERLRSSVRLPSGLTVAQVAYENGLRSDTVYMRWRRGWPEERLAAPARVSKRRPEPEGVAQ